MPSPPKTYYIEDGGTSPRFAVAFAEGCQGSLCTALTEMPSGSMAAFATPPTWPLFDAATAAGHPYYYGDHAYWRRGRYYRVIRSAVQFQPTSADLARATPDRFNQLQQTIASAWTRTGSTILVCPNSPVYMQRFDLDAAQWTRDMQTALRQFTDRPIVIRWKADRQTRPLAEDLATAHAVVVYSSNAAVEALAAGVPVFVCAPWASTASMGLSDVTRIESPIYPDTRVPFLWALAEQQWTLAEMAAGLTWRSLNADV